MTPTITLFRPLGLKELRLIFDSGYRKFPPRLSWQPIFYPVMNFEYAEQITRQWNVPSDDEHCGFVTAFDVEATYLSRFEEQNVGAVHHNELWVPAEELEAFNAHIIGDIRVVASRYDEAYEGIGVDSGELQGKTIREQLGFLEACQSDSQRIIRLMWENEYLFLTNLGFWSQYFPEKRALVDTLKQHWMTYRPQQAGNTH